MKLKSTTDFVLEQEKNYAHVTRCVKKNPFLLVVDYAKFLKQTLTLGMFVPCDENGNVLESPYLENVFHSHYHLPVKFSNLTDEYVKEYEKEKEKVLFKGFEFKAHERMICFDKSGIEIFIYNQNYQTFSAPRGRISTVEDLIIYEFELTESAIKQIGIEKSTSGNTGQIPPTLNENLS